MAFKDENFHSDSLEEYIIDIRPIGRALSSYMT